MAAAPPVTPVAITQSPTVAQAIDTACQNLINHRQSSLLVMYYPPRARITEDDLADAYQAFRDAGVTVEQKLSSIDVLLESYGGDPIAAYRLAQLIRDFTDKAYFLIAEHAYSAGTILCFSSDQVRLGHYAGLSPIDITVIEYPERKPKEEVELASIDSYLDFAREARRKIELCLREMGSEGTTQVDSDLMVEMVKQVKALVVGRFFRARSLTGYYATELLDSYMFNGILDGRARRDSVILNFLNRAPVHDFHMDVHLCAKFGLAVDEMPTVESDLAKKVVSTLEQEANAGNICPHLSREARLPFIRLYAYTPPSVTTAGGTTP